MRDALELDINELELGSRITYTISIQHQKYKNMRFGDGGGQSESFTASNGFRIRSVDVPEARQKNYPNERRGSSNNVLFVRGRGGSDTKVLRVTSISYIAALRIAVKEYNDQFKEGGDGTR